MKPFLVTIVSAIFILGAAFAYAGDASTPAQPKGKGEAAAKGQAAEKETTVPIGTANDSTFRKEVLESGTPIIALFWSPQCGPCDEVARDLSSTLAGKAKVVSINTKMAYKAQAAYRISEVPVFILFSGGKARARATGISSREQLLKKLGFK